MATETNKHGLSRYIPKEVKLAIRQACGFGCVVCGASIIDYEHIDPEFAEAKTHDSQAMALLCPACHGQVTRKFWSKDKIKEARRSPFCKKSGFSWGEFDFGNRHPSIQFAGVLLRRCSIPVAVSGQPLFKIEAPEAEDGPFRLSATFHDSNQKPVFQIIENEWQASAEPWDVEFTGGKINIHQQAGEQCLVLRAMPSDGIAIEKLRMKVLGREFVGNAETLTVIGPYGTAQWTGCFADGVAIGLSL